MFRVSQHPSSGVIQTVTAASGTVTATSLQRGQVGTDLCESCGKNSKAAVTVFSTPGDGCCGHTKHVQ